LYAIQQLSQFWYDDRTATILAQEAIAVAKDNGRYKFTAFLHVFNMSHVFYFNYSWR